MTNLLANAGQIAATGKIFMPAGDARIGMVDPADTGRVGAAVVAGNGHEGKTYTITGPETLSFTQVAEQLSEALGKRVTYVDPPVEVYRQALLDAGTPVWFADALLALYGLYSQNIAAHVTPVVADLTQRPPRTFDQFARDYAPAFSLT